MSRSAVFYNGDRTDVALDKDAPATLAAVVTLACVVPAYAQTQGMERRQGARAAEQACKAGDEKTRAECRQEKHHTKQAARQGKTPTAPAANPAQ